jgi:hypothetical protein
MAGGERDIVTTGPIDITAVIGTDASRRRSTRSEIDASVARQIAVGMKKRWSEIAGQSRT